MSTWTVSRIKTKIRELTGRPSTGQISESDLLDKINDYYVDVLPGEVDLNNPEGWYEFNTSDGTGTQALPTTVLAVSPPVFSDGDQINFWTDNGEFFLQYPFSDANEAEPLDVLEYGRELYLRPIPDATYAIRIAAELQPTAAFTQDTDTPTDNQWGPVIAYGVSIEILQNNGEDEEAKRLEDMYMFHKSSVSSKNLKQIPAGTRAAPRF